MFLNLHSVFFLMMVYLLKWLIFLIKIFFSEMILLRVCCALEYGGVSGDSVHSADLCWVQWLSPVPTPLHFFFNFSGWGTSTTVAAQSQNQTSQEAEDFCSNVFQLKYFLFCLRPRVSWLWGDLNTVTLCLSYLIKSIYINIYTYIKSEHQRMLPEN